jgi:hypothetical protein
MLVNNRWFAIVVPAFVGLGLVALSITVFRHYDLGLMIGTPLVVSFLSAFCTSFKQTVTYYRALTDSVLSILVLAGLILVSALDGLICILMALPIAFVQALIGAALGRWIGSVGNSKLATILPVMSIVLVPGMLTVEHVTMQPEVKRKVVTTVLVNAPIQRVWNSVVAFPRIAQPPSGILSLGIAYPLESYIKGTGVGAIRHCVFTTGSFIEPITHWQAPSLLAFDVTKSPPPMREISIYGNIDPPHLRDFMDSHHGQFRLFERDGHVVLEGTTWYTHRLSPQWYWGPISDHIIYRIHERVLNHIKANCEGA